MNSFIEDEDIESRYGEEIYEDFTNYQKLQQRIEKIKEYIEENVIFTKGSYLIVSLNVNELLNILNGKENE